MNEREHRSRDQLIRAGGDTRSEYNIVVLLRVVFMFIMPMVIN